ncbi:MAG: hypothetical protein GY780_17090 [bacterium]|nr:hypothetical protein [bacterium]
MGFLKTTGTIFIISGLFLGCSSAPNVATDKTTSHPVGTLQFIESVPEETTLDSPAFEDAATAWPAYLASAKSSIDVASFYFSRMGDGKDSSAPAGLEDPLLKSIQALEDAAGRNVKVRILGDSKFQKTYPELLAEFKEVPGAESRVIDLDSQTGGVMHAKYFLIDDNTLFVGSQNWDWRALSQIRELGALVNHPRMAAQLKLIFEMDWESAAGGGPSLQVQPETIPYSQLPKAVLQAPNGENVTAVLAASPLVSLPPGVPWDLPLLVELIDSAQNSVHLQLLSYNPSDREGRLFDDLDSALRRAAARKVKVEIIFSNWSKVHYKLHWIQSLAAVKNIDIKFSNIPEHSHGFVPFARVEHAKYMVVDGQRSWVGTSNWSRGYFHASRNISLFFDGSGAARPLDDFFAHGWASPYVETVDPGGDYQPPKRR